MLKDKRKDLDNEKQKKLLQRLVGELSQADMDFYYRSTSDIAARLAAYIAGEASLTADERSLLKGLSQRDIEVLLSFH